MCSKIVFCWTLLLLTAAAEKDVNRLGRSKSIDEMKKRINLFENLLTFEYTNFFNSVSPSSNPLNRDSCGKQQLTRFKRVAGGHDSSLGRIPWQVALFKQSAKKPFCGGALLSDKWIITAGHCVDEVPTKSLMVRLGVNDIKSISEKKHHQTFRIKTKVIHPEYDNVDFRNDIALLRVYKSVRFDWHIIPICLPPQDLKVIDRTATISGWGRRVRNEEDSSPAILNEVDIKIIPNHVCEKWFLEAGNDDTPIDDVFLCAGHKEGGIDSCKGDSGGPLTISVFGKRVLIGIVSWGYGCGTKFSPGLYTNVRNFVPWITKVMN